MDMLLKYIWCIPLYTKEAEAVHLVNIYLKFGGSHRILSNNGTEFKNKLFAQVAAILGIKQIHSPPYYMRGNRHIEDVYNFLMTCIHKHVSSQVVCMR